MTPARGGLPRLNVLADHRGVRSGPLYASLAGGPDLIPAVTR